MWTSPSDNGSRLGPLALRFSCLMGPSRPQILPIPCVVVLLSSLQPRIISHSCGINKIDLAKRNTEPRICRISKKIRLIPNNQARDLFEHANYFRFLHANDKRMGLEIFFFQPWFCISFLKTHTALSLSPLFTFLPSFTIIRCCFIKTHSNVSRTLLCTVTSTYCHDIAYFIYIVDQWPLSIPS